MAVKNRGAGKILLGGVILFFLLTLTACQFGGKSAEDEISWKDEVLLAHDCGMDGLPCCSEGQACFYSQVCCTDPNNLERNYCADNCACGEEKKFCCANDPKCDPGLACTGDGYCLACGGDGQPCCDSGDQCRGNLVCYGGSCRECGLAGNPCCTGGETDCERQDKMDKTRTECQNGVCVLCGFGGNAGCINEPYCLPEHLLNNGRCLPCGGYSQPCCAGDRKTGAKCSDGLTCSLGFCN